jgi:hypothetical protein
MYADDGVMLAHNRDDIQQVLGDYQLPPCGLIFSDKVREDGTYATGLVRQNIITFLGAKLNFDNGMITTDKGSVHMSSDVNKITKVIWNEYNQVKE